MKARTLSVLLTFGFFSAWSSIAFASHEPSHDEARPIVSLAHCVGAPCWRPYKFSTDSSRWQVTPPVCREMRAHGFRQCGSTKLRQWRERHAAEVL